MTAMEHIGELLGRIWQEVSRHVEMVEAATQIGVALEGYMPPLSITVLRFHADRGTFDAAVTVGDRAMQTTVSELSIAAAELEHLTAWARDGGVIRHPDPGIEHAVHACLAAMASRFGARGDDTWLAGPLVHEDAFAGILILSTRPPDSFAPDHKRLAEALLVPFSVALQNDGRLHELELLRNAAEADKIAALRRLGRDRVSGDIIGFDGGLRSVIERVERVAPTDLPVLILGETGTGKEVIARLIHERSARAGGPFVRVNSGAIPPELLDAELFGHEKGSFTGATAARRGWFERADGGTLLLDEIGELSKPAQVRLLRVLQEGVFERVGGEKPIHVNVRVIAATHRDLPAMIQEGGFREDLWYRISGFPVVLPPLRERRKDIPDLARHFARRAARLFGLMPQSPTDGDLAILAAYNWPGNIRELASVIDRAAILGEGHTLDIGRALGTTPGESRGASGRRDRPEPRSTDAGPAIAMATLADAMRTHIQAALAATRGQIEGRAGAAAILDINPHTLRARMRKLGITRADFRTTT